MSAGPVCNCAACSQRRRVYQKLLAVFLEEDGQNVSCMAVREAVAQLFGYACAGLPLDVRNELSGYINASCRQQEEAMFSTTHQQVGTG